MRVRQEDERQTALNTLLGHFEYLIMPFGHTMSPVVFQPLESDVCVCFSGHHPQLFLSRDEHISHMCYVLQWLQENRLYVKVEKCEFHCRSMKFLGYIIGGQFQSL